MKIWSTIKQEVENNGFFIGLNSNLDYHILFFKDGNNYVAILQKRSWFVPVEKTGIELVVNSEDRERRRLAVDLHDSLGQHLTGIRFLIESIDCKEDVANEILQKAKRAIDASVVELRNISYNLIPKPLDQEGLEIALQDLFGRVYSMFGIKVDFKYLDLKNVVLLKSFEVSLFRIIQEIISNSVKHGKSTQIIVRFTLSNEQLEVLIKDNGRGFDFRKLDFKGNGLRNIETRVVKFDGQIERKSSKKQGTKYRLIFPLNTIENI